MAWLILGVVIWSVVHLFPSVAVNQRKQISASMGKSYEGLFALAIILSIVLMVIGWKQTVPIQVYEPPTWGRHLTMLLILIAFILFGAANTKTRIRQWIRHPMLMGMIIWSVGHLLANGDIRSVILFGGLGLWAIVSQFTINRRDGAWVKPGYSGGFKTEAILIVVSLLIYAAVLFLHPHFTGMPVIPR